MFHPGTQKLIGYWSSLADGRAPLRADFDVAEVSELMPRLFVLTRAERLTYRLAGEMLRDLYGRTVKGTGFLDGFSAPARPLAQRSALQSVREGAPVVLIAMGRTELAREVALEITVAPLLSPSGAPDRLVGLVQPTTPLARLAGQPLREIAIRMAVAPEPRPGQPRLRLAAVDGRRIA
ncbi:PAS domain-containing protein [Brevundimonas sp.]|uniref:PAS domain-containing protein n=1 Tax=Brevundimonas sp. TaxID=1871086 RepID=UPI0025E6B1A1|nr:PAS domain-containing protein [Brevundimonas sp.]